MICTSGKRPGCLAWFLLGLLFPAALGHASEEEFLAWVQLRLVSPEREDTGQVVFTAQAEQDPWRSVEIEAFGRHYQLDQQQRRRLAGFPLSSIRTTHEAGYPQLGGHTVHFKFHRIHYRDDHLTRSELVISVSRGKGLDVGEPRHRVLEQEHAEPPPSLNDALEIAQRVVADDERFRDKPLRSVTRSRGWRGPRQGEPCWRIDWQAGPGPAYFVEVFMDGESRVVVAGR